MAETLFQALNSDFQGMIHSFDHYLSSETTSITFGSKVFTDEHIRKAMRALTSSFDQGVGGDLYPDYLRILELIRCQLAVEVDRQKFRSIEQKSGQVIVALRNVVHFKLLEHKSSTSYFLPLFHRVIETVEEYRDRLGKNEGLDANKEEIVKGIREQILREGTSHV